MIIDDDHGVTRALSALLADAGYRPTVFHLAATALKYAGRADPLAAIIDIHLPDLNGLVLCQQLRAVFGPSKPIIVVSGDSSMEIVNSLKLVGATHFFSKPVKPDVLLARLRELLG